MDPLSRIIDEAEHCDPVMLSRAEVYALCRCAMLLRASTVVLAQHPSWDSNHIKRCSSQALNQLDAVAESHIPHILGLDDLRNAS